MRNSYVLLLLLISNTSFSQTSIDSISQYFKEYEQMASEKSNALWGVTLNGPMIFVDAKTKKAFLNYADPDGHFVKVNNVFTGVLPSNIPVANTAVTWGNIRWSMVLLPLPVDRNNRFNLLFHESFHRIQNELGFKLKDPPNNHLDTKEGRTFLRLELQALLAASKSQTQPDGLQHIINALRFRKARYSIYPDAIKSENELELNEGLAEYTGLILSARSTSKMIQHFEESLNSFIKNPTFVRSFAYQTIPLYGYLLNNLYPGWNKEIDSQTILYEYFIKKLKISTQFDAESIESMKDQYNRKEIKTEEDIREARLREQLATYRTRFISSPVLKLSFIQMGITFDPRNIQPLDDIGTIYPNLSINDVWGKLTVTNGALVSKSWDYVIIALPFTSNSNILAGDGWKLELNSKWQPTKESNGNYSLINKVD